MIDEKLNNTEPISAEIDKSAERETVAGEITELVDKLGETCPIAMEK